MSLGEAVELVNQAEAELKMPSDIRSQFQGAAMAFEASLSNTLWLMLAAVVTMYIVRRIVRKLYPSVTILSTLPSAGIGALLALMLTGKDLSIIAIIGIILLIGIVKKTPS